MSENSKIEWCDHTFNPWIGCAKVSPGCANCYAETLMDTRYGRVKWGKGQPRQRTSKENWKLPLRWDRDNRKAKCSCGFQTDNWTKCVPADKHVAECPDCGHVGVTIIRPRVFCASLADWLDEEVPIEWLCSLLDLIRQTQHLDWLLLTKRPQNFYRVQDAGYRLETDSNWEKLPKDHPAVALHAWIGNWTVLHHAPSNVWIGTTVEDQTRADERIPALLTIPANVRFLSCEPLLGPVDLKLHTEDAALGPIHWVIAGGESGHHARPMHPDWARSLRDQCAAAGCQFFFKQWGEWCPATDSHGFTGSTMPESGVMPCGKKASWIGWDGKLACPSANGLIQPIMAIARAGKTASGRLLDGREHNDFPEVAKW